jgi:hypothetical protein
LVCFYLRGGWATPQATPTHPGTRTHTGTQNGRVRRRGFGLVVAFQRFICRFRPRKEGYELLRAARCAAQTMEATDSRVTDWVWCLGWFVFPRASFVCCGILGFGIGDWGRSDCRFCSRRAVAAGGPVGIPKDAQPVPPVPRPDLGPRMDALCAGRPGPGPGSVRQTHGRRLKPRPEIHTRRRPDPRFIPAKHDRLQRYQPCASI